MSTERSRFSTAATVYRLARPLASLADDLRLRNVEWGVLFAITGEHSVAQIGDLFRLAPAERDAVFERLRQAGLLEEQPLTRAEHLRALAAVRDDDAPRTLAAFLGAGAAWEGRAAPTTPGEASLEEAVTTTRAIAYVPSPGETLVPFQPLAPPPLTPPTPTPPSHTAAPGVRRLSLRALIQQVIDRADDVQSGQLDVYRVFIRVPTRLLKRNGIDTLRFQDDRLIDDPELQQALAASLASTLGMACPPSLFVGGEAAS
jgi:hypothetical protein